MSKSRVRGAIRSILYTVFPNRWIWTLRTFLLPGAYKEILRSTESVIEIPETLCDDEYWAQMLRKYAHILDKGLQRQDSEPGHSLGWYQMAQEALLQIQDPVVLSDPSIEWARQRIREYELLQQGHHPDRLDLETCLKYKALVHLIKARRSIRFYGSKEVDLETLERILGVIAWSATSCNRQTAKVFVAKDPALVKQCLATCIGATNFGEIVPVFLCFCADLRSYNMPHELFLPATDAALGMQNCSLIAHTLGLSLTFLTWAQHTPEEDKELRSLLGIPSHYQIVANGTLGYPEFGTPTPLRKSVQSTYVLCQPRAAGGNPGHNLREAYP